MSINRGRIRACLHEARFEDLFLDELGWDFAGDAPFFLPVGEETLRLRPLAQKRGLLALLREGAFPDRETRQRIQRALARVQHENLLIFHDAESGAQLWQRTSSRPGHQARLRELRYAPGQPGDGERIVQTLPRIAFGLEEEGSLDHLAVTGRVARAFEIEERITRRFYERFRQQHAAFLKFLRGIPTEGWQRWYVSVLLNRLMFIWFIQEKGFLDRDPDYLPNRLAASSGDNFYRDFLCPLFFEGFAQRPTERAPRTRERLGDVPYLNGGLFLQHEIERRHGRQIHIDNEAFGALFAFFREYRWHLDERPLRDEREINPDVLGHIFEKYINQKEMGAYYTREDITGYIGRNSILPALLDATRCAARSEFDGPGGPWRLLAEIPDAYIWPSLSQGTELNLPPEIAAGCADITQRGVWNAPAPPEYGLPTEIWRETIARRQHCARLREILESGAVRDVDALITHNLDSEGLTLDFIAGCESPKLLDAFWQALTSLSVLDPTCGSGAFLFAALRILEPLYAACLRRMQEFLDAAGPGEDFAEFAAILDEGAQHPNRRHFILRRIIVNNLFGVDLMEEAVEIARLRLFLKLVAQIERVADLEPLPDIDFNIRAGNSLVGFTTRAGVRAALETDVAGNRRILFGEELRTLPRIKRQARAYERALDKFRARQMRPGEETREADKQALGGKRKALVDGLDRLLARQYGVPAPATGGVQHRTNVSGGGYGEWHDAHRPFHWFVEFHGILRRGGFDVIIGNPPYVEYRMARGKYRVRDYATRPCGDLYAFVMERSLGLLRAGGRFGMILPVSCASADGFAKLRELYLARCAATWLSHYAMQPARLFAGAKKRLTIWLARGKRCDESVGALQVSGYRRWKGEERSWQGHDRLFQTLRHVELPTQPRLVGSALAKISHPLEVRLLQRLARQRPLGESLQRCGTARLWYTRSLGNFALFLDFVPQITNECGEVRAPSELKSLAFATEAQRDIALAALNSALFYWFLFTHSDARNLNRREILAFPLDLERVVAPRAGQLARLGRALTQDLARNSRMETRRYSSGILRIQTFHPRESKRFMDRIDRALAEHYGFSAEELDFLLNHDIKYRMGAALSADP